MLTPTPLSTLEFQATLQNHLEFGKTLSAPTASTEVLAKTLPQTPNTELANALLGTP